MATARHDIEKVALSMCAATSRKVIMVGDAGVGKTSVMFTWVEGAFRNHFSTIGAGERMKEVDVDGTRVSLDIWDTAGQERYRSQVRMYVTGSHVAIVMFDVNDPVSIDHVPGWIDLIRENSSPETKLFIVGNKTDLEQVPGGSQAIGDELAKKYGAEGYFQTSAASNAGIQTLFTAVGIAALKINRRKAPTVQVGSKRAKSGRCC
jgi:small GTP-binding protein